MYKIIQRIGLPDQIYRKLDSAWIPKVSGNKDYDQFVEDVKEQGLSIVEGADLTTDSYVDLRQKEYHSLSDQQDMQYWDQENGTTYWIDMIRTIKNKYPKSIVATTKVQPLPEWDQQFVE